MTVRKLWISGALITAACFVVMILACNARSGAEERFTASAAVVSVAPDQVTADGLGAETATVTLAGTGVMHTVYVSALVTVKPADGSPSVDVLVPLESTHVAGVVQWRGAATVTIHTGFTIHTGSFCPLTATVTKMIEGSR